MKRQIITLQKEGILSEEDMEKDVSQKMSTFDSHIIDRINTVLTIPVISWNQSENKLTITREWGDEDYNDYVANFSNLKTKLRSDGYEITESTEDF